MEKWVWEDINLDSEEDLQSYLLTYEYFKVGNTRVVFYISYYGEVGFTVDGSLMTDSVSVNPLVGAKVFIHLKKVFPKFIEKARKSGIEIFCWPVQVDEAYSRRVRAFSKVGFSAPNDEGMMTYVG
jgi:hypothetical protein